MISTLVLLVLLLVATVTDVMTNKIYNWTTYTGILLGFAIRFFEEGWIGFQDSVSGFFLCGVIMLVCFLFGGVGGGDLKMIAMMGAFLGSYRGFEALLWTSVIGAAMAFAVLIWSFGIVSITKQTAKHVWLVIRARSWIPLTPEERLPLKRLLFLAPSGLIAAVIVSWDDLSTLW